MAADFEKTDARFGIGFGRHCTWKVHYSAAGKRMMSPGVALSWYQLGIGHGYSPGARKVSEVYWGARRKTTGRRRDTAYLGNASR